MSEKNLIIPRKLAGFMELLPSKQVLLNEMALKIQNIYQKFGFMPLDTPVLEMSEILLAKSGGEIDKEIYAFTKGDSNICMRYDHTVPLARFVAMNFSLLNFPFKRYSIGKVYRGEKPQKGRFREILQCDADIIGNDVLPLVADAECIKLADEVFKALKISTVTHISNRNILFGYCDYLAIGDKTLDALIVLDKLSKIGVENAKFELIKLGLEEGQAEKLIELSSLQGPFDQILPKLKSLCDNEVYLKGFNDLSALQEYLKAYNIDPQNYVLDIGTIRGHNYYTGTVFETVMPDHLEFGAVCAGGRYDNLAGFYTDKHLPGVGISIGLTRLFDLLDKNNMLDEEKPSLTQLAIIPLGETIKYCLNLQSYFQKEVACEVFYDERSFKGKLKEANKREIPFVLIVGEDELKNNMFTLKNMQTSQQFSLTKEECLNKILEFRNEK